MQIALAQRSCVLADKEANLERMRTVVAGGGADLYVFPELFLTGYMVRDEVYRLAEGIDGKSVKAVQRISNEHGAHILFGMATWDAEVPGLLRNSAVMVSPNEIVQRYDKVNPANFGPFEEGLYFTPGSASTLMEADGHKLGVVICYDLFFPELAKSYALAGAEALICISASPITSRESFEKLMPARAIENSMYTLYNNQVGTQLNQVFFGGSHACDPRGKVVARCKYFEEDLAVVNVSADEVRLGRRMRPTVRDSLRY